MCGIFGFCGNGNIKEIIKNGLKDLEYRGYDSCGFALIEKNNVIFKKLAGKYKIDLLTENLEIGENVFLISHTRWATHGSISEINAHPHFDCKKEIFVVHNGIIENYQQLKEDLIKKGHKFISQTDTEVIPHLIEENLKTKNFFESVRDTFRILKGSFAIVVLRKGENSIICGKNGSPLVIGKSNKNIFIASDIHPISRYTDKFILLDNFEMAKISIYDGIKFYNFKEGKLENNKKIINIRKKEYKEVDEKFSTFMMKEIHQQPYVLKNTINTFLSESVNYFLSDQFKIPRRIIFTGCGTSWHAGLIGEYIIESMLKIPVEVEYSSEFRYKSAVIDSECLFIPISQSGETADTIGAIEKIKGMCPVISICNVSESSITRTSDYSIYTDVGPEIGVASTKAFTSQIISIFLFSLITSLKEGKINEKVFKNEIDNLFLLTEVIKEIFDNEKRIIEISEYMKNKHNSIYLGRGIHFPVALEGALKLKEISYIHAEGYPAAEMKHGPIALIDKNMPVVFILVNDSLKEKVISNIEEVKARNGYTILITDFKNKYLKNITNEIVYIPEFKKDNLKPVLTVIPLQLLAAYTALKRGLDIDKPRNLAKSVTVE